MESSPFHHVSNIPPSFSLKKGPFCYPLLTSSSTYLSYRRTKEKTSGNLCTLELQQTLPRQQKLTSSKCGCMSARAPSFKTWVSRLHLLLVQEQNRGPSAMVWSWPLAKPQADNVCYHISLPSPALLPISHWHKWANRSQIFLGQETREVCL